MTASYADRQYQLVLGRLFTEVDAIDGETLRELLFDLDEAACARLWEFYAKGEEDALKSCRGLWRRLFGSPEVPTKEGIRV